MDRIENLIKENESELHTNLKCKALYKRIVDKGKSKKLALIAVCNKLLKQSFAVAKSGIPYDPCYKSSLVSQ